jgi:hypothetical protein
MTKCKKTLWVILIFSILLHPKPSIPAESIIVMRFFHQAVRFRNAATALWETSCMAYGTSCSNIHDKLNLKPARMQFSVFAYVWNNSAGLTVVTLRPFVTLVSVRLSWRVESIGAMILTEAAEVLGYKPDTVPLCPPQIPTWTGLWTNPGLRDGRPATNCLSHGMCKIPFTLSTKHNATSHFSRK